MFDGEVEYYYLKGIRVEKFVVMDPSSITIERICNTQNIEQRRVMIEQYGDARFLLDSGAIPVDIDSKYGILYASNMGVGRPICFLHVINSSKEPDGTFKKYILPINPHCYSGDAGRYAQAAAASTWRTTPQGKTLLFPNWYDYNPITET